jgi:hypothetical protein
MHIYVGVNCKTCGTFGALRYLGEDVGQESVEELVPAGVTFECGQCHKSHDYIQADMYVRKAPFAPPPGWTDGWEDGSGQPLSPAPKKIQ